LRGYVGVDLVLAHDKPYVVDVNPRLTTSYAGLRRVAQFNIAEAMVNAVLNQKLPKPNSQGVCCFSKIETSKPQPLAFHKASELSAVVSPPFPIDGNDKACALLIGEGEDLGEAQLRLEEAKKHLCNIIG
jgi:hypothetical protein